MHSFFEKYIKYLILFALICIPLFGYLGSLPIRIWDESRLAINAYEMLHNKNYIVTYFEGKPDMWNTKPPLLIWIQVVCIKLFGINEFSLRLPSAIAAVLTGVTILWLSKQYIHNFWYGFIAILILVTSHGYVNFHVTRTADYDALLTLFTTLSGLLFFMFCETKKHKYLYFFFIFTALAVLTKSITGLLFTPALFAYLLIRKQLIPLLKTKHLYLGIFYFFTIVAGYYLLRENQNPGYLKAVYMNELGGRYLEVNEDHVGGFWYYYDRFIKFQMPSWIWLIPLGVVFGFLTKDKKTRRLTIFLSLMILQFFLVISTSKTKTGWYDAPLYPFLALLIANFIYFIFSLLKQDKTERSVLIQNGISLMLLLFILITATIVTNLKWNDYRFYPFLAMLAANIIYFLLFGLKRFNFTKRMWLKHTLPFVLLLFVFVKPYEYIIDKTYKPKEYFWDEDFYALSHKLQDAVHKKYDMHNTYISYEGYKAHLLFYVNILQDQGINTAFHDWKNLSPSDMVITHQNNVKQYIENKYKYKIIDTDKSVRKYKIYGTK